MDTIKRYNERKEQGLCVRCGNNNDSNGVLCDCCKDKERSGKLARIELAKRKGICAKCLKNVATQGETLCTSCNDKLDIFHIKRKTERQNKEK